MHTLGDVSEDGVHLLVGRTGVKLELRLMLLHLPGGSAKNGLGLLPGSLGRETKLCALIFFHLLVTLHLGGDGLAHARGLLLLLGKVHVEVLASLLCAQLRRSLRLVKQWRSASLALGVVVTAIAVQVLHVSERPSHAIYCLVDRNGANVLGFVRRSKVDLLPIVDRVAVGELLDARGLVHDVVLKEALRREGRARVVVDEGGRHSHGVTSGVGGRKLPFEHRARTRRKQYHARERYCSQNGSSGTGTCLG
mmetsp:Transcript_35280/g.51820  ORF Transcript_35280/g.51820 Transcript_35280/m.51820 type:complete len:251 (+) Transcript_35280:1783-2535(+)